MWAWLRNNQADVALCAFCQVFYFLYGLYLWDPVGTDLVSFMNSIFVVFWLEIPLIVNPRIYRAMVWQSLFVIGTIDVLYYFYAGRIFVFYAVVDTGYALLLLSTSRRKASLTITTELLFDQLLNIVPLAGLVHVLVKVKTIHLTDIFGYYLYLKVIFKTYSKIKSHTYIFPLICVNVLLITMSLVIYFSTTKTLIADIAYGEIPEFMAYVSFIVLNLYLRRLGLTEDPTMAPLSQERAFYTSATQSTLPQNLPV
eukprot:c10963_g1_i2.p1 GENE.c10963_g1_i2~~c10963_g1_i2.p1  ORF type:complete len:255 (+),score=46.59 c10963_g1_i2:47-811(+)